MENILTLVYEGGIYRFDEMSDLLEDVGAHILRREDTAISTMALISIYEADLQIVEEKARSIGGELKRASLAGSEIAVVSPSPSGRHLPHPSCDIAEFMRRAGAQTILINLARGVGQEPILENFERDLINECDLAVFIFGESTHCIEKRKSVLFEDLTVPIVVTGGPHDCSVPRSFGYVGGFGRKTTRLKGKNEIKSLNRLIKIVDEALSSAKSEIYSDLPQVPLPALGRLIEKDVPEVKDILSPSPITIKVDGLRVKLPYDEYSEKISNVMFMGSKLRDIASVSRSVLKDNVLVRLKPR
ncbi:MAG: methyl-coenzyme M reductase family protein [Methanomassiliicoccales archaeon]|jgi:putative methanogenesis marker protein 7